MIVPYQFNPAPPTPEGTPHLPAKPLTFETTPAGPMAAPVAKDTSAGNVAEVLLVIVVVLVIAGRVYVRLLDAAGNVLVRLDA